MPNGTTQEASAHLIHSLHNAPTNGRVHLILQSPYRQDLDRVRFGFFGTEEANGSEIVADLDLIDGMAIEVDTEQLPELMDVLGQCRRVSLTQDAVVNTLEMPHQDGPDTTALASTGAPELWEQGLTGKGVGIAVLDTGIAPHQELGDRLVHFVDMINGRADAYDDNGHGTHVSSLAAGSQAGTAPEAHVVGIKVLNEEGRGRVSDIIRGVQWAIEHREEHDIKVLNLSLGAKADKPYREDPLAQALDRAEDFGITSVVAAGNDGPFTRTIMSPAHAEHVISVGASDDRDTVDRSDDKVGSFSSRGPTRTDNLVKPDLVAPGVRVWAAARAGGYSARSGTSMAAPLVSGIVAQLLESQPEATPQELKESLMSGAETMAAGGNETVQGKGAVDALSSLHHLTAQ